MINIMKWLQILILTALVGPVSAWSGQATGWQLIYTSNLNGELKPCGCSPEGNLGGLLRRASELERQRKIQETVVVSAGDLLDEPTEQGNIKNRYIFQGTEKLRLDAILPGEREIAYAGFENLNLPWVLSNSSAYTNIPRYRKIRLSNDQQVIILGVLEPTLTKNTGVVLEEAEEALKQIIKTLRPKPKDIVVVLAHGSINWSRKISNIKRINVIVRGHLLKPEDEKIVHGEHQQPILAAGYRGQRLGLARFDFDTGKLNDAQFVPLPKSVPDHPALSDLNTQYDAEIVKWFRAKTLTMKKKSSNTTHVFASASICRQCHKAEYKKWRSTRHARAYASLTRVNKNEDPECLVCHTTGMGKANGFVSAAITSNLVDVQCESCHGAARKHAAYPVVHQPWKAIGQCKNCHTPENSPTFNTKRYWEKIDHHKNPGTPIHRQSISAIKGIYEIIDASQPVLGRKPVQVTEFFNFYCNRCYQLNKSWSDVTEFLSKPIRHKQIPIIFGSDQKPWAAIAYLVAESNGKGSVFKDAVFKAKFEDNVDISEKSNVIMLAAKIGLAKRVQQAFAASKSNAVVQYQKGMKIKLRRNVTETPTIVINNNLTVLPRHTGNNTQLLIENIREILLDMQCRQYHACDL